MSDQIISYVSARIVSIASSKGTGTGNFIAPGIILTCAHVIRSAIETGSPIQVEYYSRSQPEGPAKTVIAHNAWVTKLDEQGEECPDIGVIEIDDEDHKSFYLPTHGGKLPLTSLTEYFSMGFQKQNPGSNSVVSQLISFKYDGIHDARGNTKILLEEGNVRPGMSGAAVIDSERGRFIGIVQMTRDTQSNMGAYVIPTSVITTTLASLNRGIFIRITNKELKQQLVSEHNAEFPKYPFLKEFGVRFAALFLFGILGLIWANYHLGDFKMPSIITLLIGAIGVWGNFLTKWIGDEWQSEIARYRMTARDFFFNKKILIAFGVVVISLWLFVTSIWIEGKPGKDLPVTLMSSRSDPGQNQSFGENSFVRFLRVVNPLGDSVYIQPEGSLTKRVSLHPVFKTRLIFPDSFNISPLVIIRPALSKARSLDFANHELKIINRTKGTDTLIGPLRDTKLILIGLRKIKVHQEMKSSWLANMPMLPDKDKFAIIDSLTRNITELGFEMELDDWIDIKLSIPDSIIEMNNILVDTAIMDIIFNPIVIPIIPGQ